MGEVVGWWLPIVRVRGVQVRASPPPPVLAIAAPCPRALAHRTPLHGWGVVGGARRNQMRSNWRPLNAGRPPPPAGSPNRAPVAARSIRRSMWITLTVHLREESLTGRGSR